MASSENESQVTKCTQYPDIYDHDVENATGEEKAALVAKNAAQQRVYTAVRYLLNKLFKFDQSKLPEKAEEFHTMVGNLTLDERAYFLAVYGQLVNKDPAMGGMQSGSNQDDELAPIPPGILPPIQLGQPSPTFVRIVPKFKELLVDAVKVYVGHSELFRDCFSPLHSMSTRQSPDKTVEITLFRSKEFASVVYKLIEQKIRHDNPHLKLLIQEALSSKIGGRLDGRTAAIDISLPDLDEDENENIVADNVASMSALYFCAILEQMKLFAVADKVAEHFMNGSLPITKGIGGQEIYEYIRKASDRLTEIERRSIYGRAFGLAQGNVEIQMPNREFNELWVRFLASASWFHRQADPSQQHQQITAETVAKSANDLAVNLSLHGYGVGHFAAVELQKLVTDVLSMLSKQDVMAAYGTATTWQLVERVSSLYLGGSVNGVKHRTMATNGAKIIQWLADHASELGVGTFRLTGATAQDRDEKKAKLEKELIQYIDRWLAVTGTHDSTIEKYSEPVSTEKQPTLPSLSLDNMPSLQDAMDKLDESVPAVLPDSN